MDILLGIICAVLIEVSIEIIRCEKVNLIYRKLLLAIITVFYLLLTYALVCLAIKVSALAPSSAFIAIAIMFVLYLIKLWKQVYKKLPC